VIRVLHVIDKLSVDGSELHGISRGLVWWNRHLDSSKVRFRVLSLRGREEKAAHLFRDEGVDLKSLRFHKFDPSVLWALCREATEWNADVLHLHGYSSTNFGRLASKIVGIPNVVHEHVVFPSEPLYQVAVDSMLSGITDSSLAVAPMVADYMVSRRKVPARSLSILFFGVPFEDLEPPTADEIRDARVLAGLAENERAVVTVGRLARQKGLSFLVEAMARLVDIPDLCLVIVGEGPEREAIETLAGKLNLSKRIKLVGFQEDVRPWIAMADVFVIPSLYEGGPITLFEAMRLSRAIVSTPVGLAPEAIADGRNGILVPPSNPTALAGALEKILRNDTLAKSLGAAAFASSGEWDIRKSVERLTGFYEKILGNGNW